MQELEVDVHFGNIMCSKGDGWKVSTHLGSRQSIQRGPYSSGVVTLNFSVYKYV